MLTAAPFMLSVVGGTEHIPSADEEGETVSLSELVEELESRAAVHAEGELSAEATSATDVTDATDVTVADDDGEVPGNYTEVESSKPESQA